MFYLTRPNARQIDAFLEDQAGRSLSYGPVGGSRSSRAPPATFVNSARIQLGTGAETFAAARRALQSWSMFPRSWIDVFPAGAPLEEGVVVLTLAHCYGVWTANACRIVYTLNERQAAAQAYGFGYGTLHGHQMAGEERFSVHWNRADDSVWYELWSFSWPARCVAKCCLPLVRRVQRRFAVESPQAILAAVRNATCPTAASRASLPNI
jgi:uncharacterized protein (UPF0548 family)